MIIRSEALALALTRVHEISKKQGGGRIVRSNQILRSDFQLLVKTRWLQKIIKGWYMLVRPEFQPGDSTVWYANFWDFIERYLEYNLENEYCLSAENSLDLHVGSTIIPKQVIVMSPKGNRKPQGLPFDTSVMVYSSQLPEDQVVIHGVKALSLPYALCRVSPIYFQKNPKEAEIALGLIRSHTDLVSVILKYKLSNAAERLIGAYRFLKQDLMANAIEDELKSLGLVVKPENPFAENIQVFEKARFTSPYVGRILATWKEFRETIVRIFPKAQGLPQDKAAYILSLDESYAKDAYNSLSIEGYEVSPDLIERVKNSEWNPELHPEDKTERNALAARGYYEAHLAVKNSILQVLNGENPGALVTNDLQKWYQKLFAPSVTAGILRTEDLVGYRKGQVFIRNARHIPLPKEALLDAMESLFSCLKNESEASVRAVLGHYIFVFIHPYMDGNGRIARFLMNTMFASGGYPWTIIQVKNREKYMKSLEIADVEQNIEPFARFILEEMEKTKSS
jgi:Fic family protein